MPTYLYVAVDLARACAHCRAGFEAKQSMADEPLRACPECGGAVRRAIVPVGISTGRSPRSLLSDKSLKQHGFTKLINEGDGKFRKI